MLLKDKIAIVTGAASGIGQATACLFAREGARVVIADTNEAEGESTAQAIRAAGGNALFIRSDVSSMDDVRSLVGATLNRFGQIDVVHSNAAAYSSGSAAQTTEVEWDRTIDTCLKSAWMLAHCTMPELLKRDHAAFIITSSVHAIQGYANFAAYQAAKGGLLALTRALAAEGAPRVRVNAILPGAVITGLWKNISAEDRAKVAQFCPLKRNGTPEEIASVALFLVSPMSSYITGTAIIADGGLSSIYQLPSQMFE